MKKSYDLMISDTTQVDGADYGDAQVLIAGEKDKPKYDKI